MTGARGRLFLVVGPSGAGKDSLLQGARGRLAGDDRFVFPRRCITRPPEPLGEDHVALTPEAFANLRAAGDFALAWTAHGLAYGIPRSIEDDLASGRHVVVNVSRSVIAEARARLAPILILHVTAPANVLEARLSARGREDAADRQARLSRAEALDVTGADVVEIVNDGALETAVERFVAALLHPPSG